MKSADFLDALQRKFRVNSDRKLAAQLGWDRARLSGYRTGRREFDERTCYAVAQLLNVSPAWVMAEIAAERADCTEVRDVWKAMARMLRDVKTHAASVLIGVLVLVGGVCMPGDVQAGAADGLYIIRRRQARRQAARVLRALRRFYGSVTEIGAFSPAYGKIDRLRAAYRPVLMLTLTLALPVLAGCAGLSADVMVGSKIRDGGFHGAGPTATLRLRQAITPRVWCEYEHVSHWLVGPPFGDKSEEDSLDQVGCGVRFAW